MKKEKEDFYISMLRYGKQQFENGFKVEDLIKYLQKQGHFIPSENSILLHHYFPLAFYAKNGMPYPDIVSFYFLKPEGYFHLLEYDSILASRKEARETKRLALVAIIISLISIVGPWILDRVGKG